MINVYDGILSDPGYFKQLSVKDTLWVNYQCPQVVDWAELYSPFNFFIYTIGGKKMLQDGDRSMVLEEGSLVFLKKGAIRHKKFFDAIWNVVVFCVPDNYLQRSLMEYRSQKTAHSGGLPLPEAFIGIETNETTHAFFYSLLPYFTQVPAPPENLLELKCRELMFIIFSQSANNSLLAYIDKIGNGRNVALIEVMEANFRYNLSLKEFATINQRSLSAFKKDFAAVFGTSPGKWLLDKRLQYAQFLLAASSKDISAIAYDSGFESVTHFSRVFKDKFETSPLQYRKQAVLRPPDSGAGIK